MTKLLFLSGSIRTGSLNTKLAKAAAKIAREAQVEVTYIDLQDFGMPIYNADLEAKSGLPENAKKLKELFIESAGFFIASPEYNSSFSALLKNSLDWISRPSYAQEKPLIAFEGKVAAISSASPGGFGGLRGLIPLRSMLSNIGVIVTPKQIAISNALEVFDEFDDLKDEGQKKMLRSVVEQFVYVAKKVSS